MFETDTRTELDVLSVGTINEASVGESLNLQNVTKWERVVNIWLERFISLDRPRVCCGFFFECRARIPSPR